MKTCSASDCEREVWAKDLCNKHYGRKHRTGSLDAKAQCEAGAGVKFLESLRGFEGEECVRWPYGIGSSGYGAVTWRGRRMGAHRVMCELRHGPPPFPKADAAHQCGNRWCVNPNHLRFATRKQNADDARRHGTMVMGASHPGAKLTEANVRAIMNDTRSLSQLAEAYECSVSVVHAIKQRRRWKHITAA